MNYRVTILAALIFLSGCLPQDVGLPTDLLNSKNASPVFAGFDGLAAATTVGATKVKLTWTKSSDSSVVAYNVYDATLLFSPKLIKTVAASSGEVTITGLTAQNYYSFRVRAANKDNKEDGNTKDLGAIPYAGISEIIVQSSSSALVKFSEGSNADEIHIYCKKGVEPLETLMARLKNVGLTQTLIQDLEPGAQYTCRTALDISGFVDNNISELTFVPMGTASVLEFSTQPNSAAAGVAMTSQPVITIKDDRGNIVSAGPDSSAIVSLTLSVNSPTLGTVRGSASVAAVAGIAKFTEINFQEAGFKILRASKSDTSAEVNGSSIISVDSNQFTITPGTVSPTNSSIAISPEVPPSPALIANGVDSYVVTIELNDEYGNAVVGTIPTFSSTITGDVMVQPVTATDADGRTSGSISSSVADSNPVRKLKINSPSGLTAVEIAAPFVHGAAAKLGFTQQPVNSPAGAAGLSQVKVAILDSQGNVVTTGAAATSDITMSISSNLNGAVILGSTTVQAVAGVATFVGLGIDKTQTGYKLLASSGALTPAYSNSFNVTAGAPQKIKVAGATDVLSGLCSAAITVQLQDLGNNPTNALQNNPVVISGLGGASLFSGSTCGGTAISNTITFTAGTNTRTIYLKSNKAQQLSITATDSSSVMQVGTHTLKVSPNKITFKAESSLGGPFEVVAGQCSTELIVTPLGEDGQPGPIFTPTTINFTGILGTQGKIYTDSACSLEVSPTAAVLPVSVGTVYETKFYFRDNKSEILSVTVIDPQAVMGTISPIRNLTVLPSALTFTGPTEVVAGACSTSYTVTLRDAQANAVIAQANTTLTLNGLSGKQAQFFYSPSCTGTAIGSSVTIPEASSQVQIYMKDLAAETLSLYVSDPLNRMLNSATINVAISPSALRLTLPNPANAKTSICAGPFQIDALDGVPAVTAAISPINVNLAGAGTAGKFFSDSGCTAQITSFVFATGESTKTFYFKGQYPAASLSFSVTDAGGILTSDTKNFTVNAAKAWIGTGSKNKDENGNLLWFQDGVKAVSGRVDSANYPRALRFTSDYRYLYVVDWQNHKVLKYDYQNKSYVGWLGRFWPAGNIGIVGSNLATPSTPQCVATVGWQQTPGWCVGGQSTNGDNALGGLYHPSDVVDDGAYIYVANYHGHTVTRYVASTGAFAGWIGKVNTISPTAAAPGGPASCTSTTGGNVTPGWCIGGNYVNRAWEQTDGGFYHPNSLAVDSTYLYVGNQGQVQRYLLSDGSYQGWIGLVGKTPTGGAAGCSATAANQQTPGWCLGGTSRYSNPNDLGGGGFQYTYGMKIVGSILYVNQGWGGYIARFDLTSGAYLGRMPNLSLNWVGSNRFDTDGTDFFFADSSRLVRTDSSGLLTGWIGKVSNVNSMSGSTGCDTLVPNANTPGWCLGGSSKNGMDDRSFNRLYATVYDGAGSLLTIQEEYPGIKKFNAATGVFEGMLSFHSTSPSEWSNDATIFAQYEGFDDKSMFNPRGMYVNGDYLYLTEAYSARVKKIDLRTGETVGSIGGITSVPTGGAAGCTAANSMAASPSWCLGALFNPYYIWGSMISTTADGIMYTPTGVTGDGTYLYVVDQGYHRISKFVMATGQFVGWIGRISGVPTGGDPGCAGAPTGSFTPGWCKGGTAQYGTGDGHLYNPTGITYAAGNLYLQDHSNHRIVSYDATTGAFRGWIGRIGTNPTSGCTFGSNGAYNVSQSGWCLGGTSTASAQGDRGGGFYFWSSDGGLYSDGVHLYVPNFYNRRIDKWTLNGEFVSALRARSDVYVNTWSTNAADMTTWTEGCYPFSVWADGTYMYASSYGGCGGTGNAGAIVKYNLSTGSVVGWQGGIRTDTAPPTGGDPGCAGAATSTPGWCQGGGPDQGFRMGQWSGHTLRVTGDAHYIYVSDESSHRVTRLPK